MDANIIKYVEGKGYTFVQDIFFNWEKTKDELLVSERKTGTGNGTVHVFLGQNGYGFLKEYYPEYYNQVELTNDAETNVPEINHIFLKSNLFSLLGSWTYYYYSNENTIPMDKYKGVMSFLDTQDEFISTTSLIKWSITENASLRAYFKKFEKDGAFYKVVREFLFPGTAYKISIFKNPNGELCAVWLLCYDSNIALEETYSCPIVNNEPKRDIQKEFYEYLLITNHKDTSAKSYAYTFAVSDSVTEVVKAKTNKDSLFDLLNIEDVKSVYSAVKTLQINITGNNSYSAAVSNYIKFLEYLNSSNHIGRQTTIPGFLSYGNPPSSYTQFITAIKTKPFVLLAGISGTGKSRIVRQLARACDTIDANPWGVQKPQNFEMIQVRPDWHDGSELLGYESRISGRPEYVVKNFVKFIVKAWIYEDEKVPFFLCLDEMNLAPVEQYFAEYLSVVESRRLDESGRIVCDPLIRLNKQYCQSIANEIYGASESDENDASHLSEVESLMSILEGLDYCIPLPKNLIVMGTVNMDETTFSFSRKVLDRAMTIEMNEVDLNGGLVDVEKERFRIAPEQILPNAVEGKDVYAGNKALCDKVVHYLQQVNDVLEGTPFKIAYRTRNEFLIYAVNRGEDHLVEALDEMTSMKILSRIEGDQEKIKDLLDRLKEVMEKSGIGSDSQSIKKIKEMNDRLGSGYTSYWS